MLLVARGSIYRLSAQPPTITNFRFIEIACPRSAPNHLQNLLQNGGQELTKRELDQKAAIMIVIEHVGNVAPGTKCSAVFFDNERIRREKEFYAKMYSENGVHDLEILRAMVAANVPDDPYWLVSLKTGDGATVETTRLHRVDDRTAMVLPDPA